jgi:hypothetical protein
MTWHSIGVPRELNTSSAIFDTRWRCARRWSRPVRFPGRAMGETADALPAKNISALGSPPNAV